MFSKSSDPLKLGTLFIIYGSKLLSISTFSSLILKPDSKYWLLLFYPFISNAHAYVLYIWLIAISLSTNSFSVSAQGGDRLIYKLLNGFWFKNSDEVYMFQLPLNYEDSSNNYNEVSFRLSYMLLVKIMPFIKQSFFSGWQY